MIIFNCLSRKQNMTQKSNRGLLFSFKNNSCRQMFKRCVILLVFTFIIINNGFAQKLKSNVLTKKYSPAQLKEDVNVMASAILKMHPVIGIYKSRPYYIALFDSLKQAFNDSLTEKQFRIKLKIFLNNLHCGHTEALPSRQYLKFSEKQQLSFSPYVFIPIQNKIYVLATVNKKKDSLLKKGTEVIKINGVSSDSMLNLCRQLITSDGYNITGKNHYLKLGFNSYYPALFGRPDTFNIEYKAGNERKTLKYAAIKIKNIPSIPLVAKDDTLFTICKKASLKYKYIDSSHKTLFLRLNSFSRKKYAKAYHKIFKKLKNDKAENLVIDLRYNGGGSIENSYRLLSYLLDSSQTQTLRTGIKKYPDKKYTTGNIWFKLMRFGFKFIAKKKTINDTDNYVYTIKPVKKNHYDKKIYVLINGGSFSASCLVAAYLKYNRRAVFVGEETAGASEGCNAGITPYYKLPNTKVKIRVPAFRIVNDVCPQITGHGIMPDYKIEYTIKDILARRDLELQKVKELIATH